MLKDGQKFNIAIDGPAGAGKSTIAQKVAARLGFVYIDTGAMYRAFTWKCVQEGISSDQLDQIEQLSTRIQIELIPDEKAQKVYVDGEEVTQAIRSNVISQIVSKYAQIAAVRKVMTSKQKAMAASRGVVMDGRDIGTHVMPDAELKIYLTASVETRAKRRLIDMQKLDPNITLEQLKHEIEERDRMDKERKESPLTVAEGAVIIDSSNLTIDEVTEQILQLCENR